MKKLKVLFFSQRFPFPMDTGGKIRTGKILEQINEMFDITLICNFESPKDDKYFSDTQRISKKFIPVHWKEVEKYSVTFYLKIMVRFFSRYPITVLNDYSRKLETAILNELKASEYDLAICDFLQPSLNFRNVKSVPKILFQHNVESVIVERYFREATNPILRLFWWTQYKKMFYQEKKLSKTFDKIIAVSELDKKNMEDWYDLENVQSIPTGVDVDFFNMTDGLNEKNQIVFVGSMDWLPNEDAMIYFISGIFPAIKKGCDNVFLLIVGRNPSSRIQRLIEKREDIKITGWVEDVRPFIAESAVFIVPLRIGGGTRIKIYEAMAMGKAVVSTSIGAEGLPLEHEKHIFFEDEADKFASRVIQLLRNAEDRNKIGISAKEYVTENFAWAQVSQKFADICRDTINHS
jgi:glycosyltransferase involved in cell wall biosynthesis